MTAPHNRGILAGALTFGALAVVAARQFFPSIDAETGSGALFVLAAWAVGLLAAADMFLRPGPSATVPIFAFLVALSTWLADYKHPPLHMLGEWVGVIGVWAAVRRTAGPVAMKRVAMLLTVLALAEASLTWRQVHTDIPELLQRYRRGDVGILRDLARAGVEPGFMFQSRLEAKLPWGTFGHTNALAGFLMFATPMLIVMFAAAWRARPNLNSWIARLLATASLGALLFALALTKGRSAWVGAVAALAVMLLASESVRRMIRRRWPWMLAAGAFVVAVFFWKAGNAAESLRYRFEYWRGAFPVVKSHPWFGVGWGCFRDHYLEHKLVESSEEVADPHNVLVEVAAACGLPAALAYLWWLVATVRGLLAAQDDERESTLAPIEWLTLAAVLASGVGLVLTMGYAGSWTEAAGWGIPLAFAAVFLLEQFAPLGSTRTWRVAVAAAVVGLHVHLLAAGGVGHPGTMLACWALAAAAGPSTPVGGRKRWRDFGLLAALFSIGAALGSPQLARRTVERDPIIGRIRNVIDAPLPADVVRRLYDQALALTPGDADLWADLAHWLERRMFDSEADAEANYLAARSAFDRALELQPRRSQFWLDRGMLRLEAAARGLIGAEGMAMAVADVGKASDLYPNSPSRRADVAFAAAATKQETPSPVLVQRALEEWRTMKDRQAPAELGERLGREAARRLDDGALAGVELAARRALELDAATPHYDKKLTPAERAWLRGLAAERQGTGDGG